MLAKATFGSISTPTHSTHMESVNFMRSSSMPLPSANQINCISYVEGVLPPFPLTIGGALVLHVVLGRWLLRSVAKHALPRITVAIGCWRECLLLIETRSYLLRHSARVNNLALPVMLYQGFQ